jgi:hypothetical protein
MHFLCQSHGCSVFRQALVNVMPDALKHARVIWKAARLGGFFFLETSFYFRIIPDSSEQFVKTLIYRCSKQWQCPCRYS